MAGPFTRIGYEEINLNSGGQVKKYLLSIGWKPTQYNYKKEKDGRWAKDGRGRRIPTSPILTEDSFDSIKDDTGQLLARRAVLTHRRNSIQNYKKPEEKGILAYVRPDGRVPAEGELCRTPTTRTAHRRAVCNVPKNDPKVILGKEMRQIFCVKPPYVMLGADLDQIEARITSHYAWNFDDGAYWEVLKSVDDIHAYNAKLIDSDRGTAKGFQYAIFFGAQAAKLASIIGCSLKEAQMHIDNFWDGNRGVYEIVQYLIKYYKKYGYIRGLDGRKLFVRAEYKLLNILIQSAAAIVFKMWGVLANRKLRALEVDCQQIIAYHDEFDYRCHPDCVDLATSIIKAAAIEAGEYFNIKVPITVDVKVGMNWAEVH